jgi:hypothetical protein
LQSDGNLVPYNATHHAVWATGTNGKYATYALMQSDGNFVLYTAGGKAVWATHTNGKSTPDRPACRAVRSSSSSEAASGRSRRLGFIVPG